MRSLKTNVLAFETREKVMNDGTAMSGISTIICCVDEKLFAPSNENTRS